MPTDDGWEDIAQDDDGWEDIPAAAAPKPKWAQALGGSGKPAQPSPLSWWEKLQQASSGLASQYPDVLKGAAKEVPLMAQRAARMPLDIASGATDLALDATGLGKNETITRARIKQAEDEYKLRQMLERPFEEGADASAGEKFGRGAARVAPQVALGVATSGASLPVQMGLGAAAQGAQSLSEGAEVGEAAGAAALAGAAPLASAAVSKAGSGLRSAAVEQYLKALNPTTRAMKAEAEKIVPELLERGVTGSMKALQERGAAESQKAGAQLGAAYGDASASGMTVDAKQIAAQLNSLKEHFLARSGAGKLVPTNPAALSAIKGLQKTLTRLGDNVSPDQLWKFRQNIDEIVQQAGGFAKDQIRGTSGSIAKGARAKVQDALNAVPNVEALNREYALWNGLRNVAKATGARKVGQQGAAGQLARASGAVAGVALGGITGGIGGGIGGAIAGQELAKRFTNLMSSPTWRTMSAVTKDKIGRDLAAGRYKDLAAMLTRFGAVAASGNPASRNPDRAERR
jgi:hypothetical protein